MGFLLPKKLFGIIGYPLGHSLSPLLHNWGFSRTGIEAVYMSWPLQPEKIEDFMNGLRCLPISGASVTIPHKLSVRKFIDMETERATSAGAVNTLYWDGEKLVGDNTDVAGCYTPLMPYRDKIENALILGAGGAARAAVSGLKILKIKNISITNRTAEKAEKLAEEFNITKVEWDDRGKTKYDLIINSTPLGMSGERVTLCPMLMENIDENTIVYDLVYNPLKTVLLHEAEKRGATTISGLEMFLHQGLEQFRIWTGKELDPAEARKLLLEQLK
ncbi:shikimate dehydrogenase [Maridesulfovibrio bastinii]|uniref:shikimate dehydrogenase n=1 Tax=Maridesulfovibrio bastinii TaxID=47157 RepID=UPI0003F9F110|nr:shikimate dehydrogenase [Maridesulfovibrio bastinii]